MQIKTEIIKSHPFSYIEELKSITCIRSFDDILKIRDILFTLIPWTIENGVLIELEDMYEKFKRRECGGWCGLHAQIFQLIMQGYKVSCETLNYGLNGFGISHVANKVTYSNEAYYIDSYFAKHYVDGEGLPLTFNALMELLHMRKFEDIHSFYGPVKKYLQNEKEWDLITPEDFESRIVNFFDSKGMKKILRKIFGCEDFRILMTIRIPPTVKKEEYYYGDI